MPQLSFNKNQLSFIGKNGKTYASDEKLEAKDIAKVRVYLSYNGNLPTKEQSIGILSQIEHTPVDRIPRFKFYDPSNKNNNIVSSMMLDYIFQNENVKKDINNFINQGKEGLKKQDEIFAKWAKMSPQVVAISGLRIRILLDGEVVGEKKLNNTVISNGRLPDIYLSDLDEYKINRLKENGFEIEVDYLFKDVKKSSITAKFNLAQMIDTVIDESRKMSSSSSSSGVQFLGFGKRRKTMSESVKDSFKEQTISQQKANTVIEMEDVDDSMMDIFEEQFFPKISQEKLVQEHLLAAEKAQAAGNAMLAKAHFGYAKAIQDQKDNLDVDIKDAIDSLNKKDYAGFIAKGLKIQNSKSSGNSQYSRVISSHVEEGKNIDWTFNKSVSVNRAVTQLINTDEKLTYKAALGLCNAAIIPWTMPIYKGYGYLNDPRSYDTNMYNYLVPYCIVEGSPLQASPINFTTPIKSIDGVKINSFNDLIQLLDSKEPGDEIELVYIGTQQVDPINIINVEKSTKIKLTRGPAK